MKPKDLARVEDLLERASKYLEASRSQATRQAYRSDLERFVKWCGRYAFDPETCPPSAVALFFADIAPTTKAATIRRSLASLSIAFAATGRPSPRTLPQVRETMRGILATHGSAQCQATPIMVDQLRAMLAQLATGSPRDLRDRSMILLAWSGALRESELVALDVDDVLAVPGGLELTLRRRKTDQAGVGTTIAIGHASHAKTCPVRAWLAWLEALVQLDRPDQFAAFPSLTRHHGTWQAGPRLRPRALEDLVRTLAHRAQLPAGHWTGHSLRSGFATAAAAAGIPDRVIMATTGHRSRATLDRYVRTGHRWDDVPTGRLL